MLCAKGVARIRKHLKKHGPMTRKELESGVKRPDCLSAIFRKAHWGH